MHVGDRESDIYELLCLANQVNTNLEVNSLDEAIEKINWYQQKWKIEVFHKILKSGLKTESLRFRDAKVSVHAIKK